MPFARRDIFLHARAATRSRLRGTPDNAAPAMYFVNLREMQTTEAGQTRIGIST